MSLFLHYLSMPYLLEGIELTLEVTALGLGGGLILGLILAWMQLSRFRILAALVLIQKDGIETTLLKKWSLDAGFLEEPRLLTAK